MNIQVRMEGNKVMEDTKFRYVFKHRKDSDFQYESFSLAQIESGCARDIVEAMLDDGYEIISRDMFIGFPDKNGKEIFAGDCITCKKHIGGNLVDYVCESGYVEFVHGAFGLHRKQGYYRPFKDWLEDYEIEITSKIYESPASSEVTP